MGGFISKFRTRFATKEDREHHFREWLKEVRTWQLILVLIPLLFLTATVYRLNHLKMNSLKDDVMTADRAYEDDDGNLREGKYQPSQAEITANIEEKLTELKKYVGSHTIISFVEKNGRTSLTFGTGPFYLEHQYNRLAAIALKNTQEKAANMSYNNPNGNIYEKASEKCRNDAIAAGWTWNWTSPAYISCMTEFINSFAGSDDLASTIVADIPDTSFFRYEFISPVWTPSLAGIMTLLCVFLVIWIIVRIITWILLHIALFVLKNK